MATINQMRSYILECYPNASKEFRTKVATRMRTEQVIAIYYSLLDREKKKESQPKPSEPEFHQMDIWEWMVQCNERNGAVGTHTDISQPRRDLQEFV